MSEKTPNLAALQIEYESNRQQKKLSGHKEMSKKIETGVNISINDVMRAWANDRNAIFEQYVAKVHLLYDKLYACEKKK